MNEFIGDVIEELEGAEFMPFAEKRDRVIRFCTAPDNFYAKRVSRYLTVFISMKTGEVIGGKIENLYSLEDTKE